MILLFENIQNNLPNNSLTLGSEPKINYGVPFRNIKDRYRNGDWKTKLQMIAPFALAGGAAAYYGVPHVISGLSALKNKVFQSTPLIPNEPPPINSDVLLPKNNSAPIKIIEPKNNIEPTQEPKPNSVMPIWKRLLVGPDYEKLHNLPQNDSLPLWKRMLVGSDYEKLQR